MSSLSRLNTNLQILNPDASQKTLHHLYIDGDAKYPAEHIANVNYNNCFQLHDTNEYLAYQWCNDYTLLTIYSMRDAISGKTLVIHLPKPLLEQNHTSTIFQSGANNELICFDFILSDGIFVSISLPIDFIVSRSSELNSDHPWIKISNPYDFSVRPPQLLFHVDEMLSIVFLKDGGLLGLKRFPLEVLNDYDLQPILFNDSSYFQRFTRIFSKSDNEDTSVVSTLLYHNNTLITLTNNGTLKFWDLESYQLIVHFDLKQTQKIINYGSVGNFISLYDNLLFVYLPVGNGLFQPLDLNFSEHGKLNVSMTRKAVPVNLSSFSIWSLIDMHVIKPLTINNTVLNLALLWKSNTVTKLQILNFIDSSLETYQWLHCNNTYLSDIFDDHDLITNGNMEKALLNLKSHYSQATYEVAQNILSQNNIVLRGSDPHNQEYLVNLESLLKELHKKYQEPSSLTIFNNELLVVNCLQLYQHTTYKVDSNLEEIFFNIQEKREPKEPLEQFLTVLHGFSSTISLDTMNKLSDRFLDLVNGNISHDLPLKDKFTILFQECLKNEFQATNLTRLLDNLNSVDVVAILTEFLEVRMKSELSPTIDLLNFDNFSSVVVLESVKQSLVVLQQFILDILLIFTIVDIDYQLFSASLQSLLELHFNIRLWLQLNKIDIALVVTETFNETSKYGYGALINSYGDLSNYTNKILGFVHNSPQSIPPIFSSAFTKIILNDRHPKETETNQFLHFVVKPYHITNDVLNEFIYALALYKCEEYDESLNYFVKHDFAQNLELPSFLEVDQTHLWFKLFSSISSKDQSLYYYELSKLYSHASSYANALQTIKKSIALNGSKREQLIQYLDTLIVFSDFKEIIDVIRLEQDKLGEDLRLSYFTKLLTDQTYASDFTGTLFSCCHEINVVQQSLLLSIKDYLIIDSILSSQVELENWNTVKKLYAYRILNQHERKACEVLFDYILLGTNYSTKRKCALLISNVLKTFTEPKDQWFISSTGQIIHLPDLEDRLSK